MKSRNYSLVANLGAALIVGMASLFLFVGQAHAGFYKCIDNDGNTTYSQTPCPIDEKTDKIISAGGSSSSNNDCRIARHFMSKTAKQMLRGQSSSEIFGQYGGIDSIPRTSVALINYVYTFQYNHKVTAERITSLSVARCQSGSFGPTQCEDFPYPYIDGLGGCERAALGPYQGDSQANQQRSEEDGEQPYAQRVQQSTSGLNFGNQIGTGSSQAVQTAKINCIIRTESELASINSRMRGRLSATEQDSLRSRKRALQKKLSNCK